MLFPAVETGLYEHVRVSYGFLTAYIRVGHRTLNPVKEILKEKE